MERIQVYLMSIKFQREQMLEMEQIIKDFLTRKGVKLSIPVDIFEVASFLGFDVRGTEFGESLEGILLVDENRERILDFDSNKIIAYNCRKDIQMKKFIVAHELAHYIDAKKDSYDRKIVMATRDHEEGYSDNIEEQRMDYMAAALLIPKDDLLKQLENLGEDEKVEKVVKRYNVSDEMAKRRIEEVLNG